MGREWARYEGNALRDLFRELRARFVLRHATTSGTVLDVGAGPGRFSPLLGGSGTRLVLFDLSVEMLRRAREELPAERSQGTEFVRGDASTPPFVEGGFSLVAALGNVLGHMGSLRWPSLSPLDGLVAEHGRLMVEIVPGFGERSVYLSRLPPRAVARVLRSPRALVRGRVLREGFRIVPSRASPGHTFRRLSPLPLARTPPKGWRVEETVAVAPALGFDAPSLEATREDSKAWSHLLELEEELGRLPERWANAAAVLIALRRD